LDEDTTIDINLLFCVTDQDAGDPLAITFVAQPAHGTITEMATEATWKYTPAANYNGDDAFSFTVKDAAGAKATGTVSLTITSGAQVECI
jgi:hypothetical protein